MGRHVPPPMEIVCWTAGFVDGEGWMGHRTGRWFRMGVSQSDGNGGERVCRRLRDEWRVGNLGSQDRVTNLGIQSLIWTWQVSARWDCHFVLATLLPYLRVKTSVAAEVIKAIEEHPQRYRRWSPWEDEYLTANIEILTVSEIGATLERNNPSVWDRCKRLGIGQGKGGSPANRRRGEAREGVPPPWAS
jgi:hypothetical protein